MHNIFNSKGLTHFIPCISHVQQLSIDDIRRSHTERVDTTDRPRMIRRAVTFATVYVAFTISTATSIITVNELRACKLISNYQSKTIGIFSRCFLVLPTIAIISSRLEYFIMPRSSGSSRLSPPMKGLAAVIYLLGTYKQLYSADNTPNENKAKQKK